MPADWTNLAYLIASILFILGIRGMTHPRTARRGNFLSAVGMLLAISVTLPQVHRSGWTLVIAGLGVGTLIGAPLSRLVKMKAVPQLVAIFNGFGGGASVLVAGATLIGLIGATSAVGKPYQELVATAASGLIGTVTFWGSMVAFAKLQEIKIFSKPLALPGQQFLKGLFFTAALVLAVMVVLNPSQLEFYWGLVGVATVLGFILVLPIGGGDMPVVIALLNSFSGLAAAATGFVLNNNMLIIAGSLVGASGLILTQIMCKAMNRSLGNVLFGKIEAGTAARSADQIYEGKIKEISASEIVMLLEDAHKVVIVPGYGMAVAQAQSAVRDFFQILQKRGTDVEFAIHPVAGRMPGHMNVLLAEVDIPYDKLKEMDQINPVMDTFDVAIVLGANDVVNPDARSSNSPIAGMPIIDVDKANTTVVIKRSLSPGFAGIPNPLFAMDRTLMYFNDGREAIVELISELKKL